jgi:putative NADH-flavin reductase
MRAKLLRRGGLYCTFPFDMKRILLFGATGRTGKQVLKYTLDKGYKVTALVRSPEKITEKKMYYRKI